MRCVRVGWGEVRGLDERSKSFNEVVDEIQRWARKSVGEKSSVGVHAISEEKEDDMCEESSRSVSALGNARGPEYGVSMRGV